MQSASTSSRATAALKRPHSSMAVNYISGFLDKAKIVPQMPPQNGMSYVRGGMPVKINQTVRERVSGAAQNAVDSVCHVIVPKKPEHATWDLKGRIQHLEEYVAKLETINKELEQDRHLCDQQIALLEQVNNQLNKDVVVKSLKCKEALSTIKSLEKKLRDQEEEFRLTAGKKDREIQELNTNIESSQQRINWLKTELEAYQLATSTFGKPVNNLTASQSCLQAQFEATKELLDQEQQHSKYLQETIETLKSELQVQCGVISSQESKLREGESFQTKLHTTIQELKEKVQELSRIRAVTPDSVATVCRVQSGHHCSLNQVTTGCFAVGTSLQPAHGPRVPPQSFNTTGLRDDSQSEVLVEQRRLDVRRIKDSDLFKKYYLHKRHFVAVPNIFLPWTEKQWKLELRTWKRRMRSSML